MLDTLIRFSLQQRLLVLSLALGLAVWGGVVGARLPIDVLPDLNRPTVTILTEAHGLLPEDVETQVTWHIERAVNGAAGVQRIRSSSGIGLSVVAIEFSWDTGIYQARQVIQERLQLTAGQLPPGVQPQMAPIASIMGQVQQVGLVADPEKVDLTELRSFADQMLRPRLLAVPGVAQVISNGGSPRQLQVTLDLDRMRALGVTVHDVKEAIQAANHSASGGVFEHGSQGLLVQVAGRVRTAEDLARAVVRDAPQRPIRLEDIAEVRFAPAAVLLGAAGVNGESGVILVVSKQPGVDTVTLARALEAEVEALRPSLPEGVTIYPSLYRQAGFIERAVDNVEDALIDGSILVVLVLFLFLFNLRSTLITLAALPLSVAITTLVFSALGVSINTMTLGGLAVAIGALVDDAIVDVENVYRRLRQDAGRRPVLEVVFAASSEVRKPILIGTLVVCAVYLPLFALSGMEGRLFAPIGMAYILSLMASLLVALTLTPVLCSYLLPGLMQRGEHKPPIMVRFAKALATRCIEFSLARPAWIFAGVVVLSLAVGVLVSERGRQFLPAFNEGAVQVNLMLPVGTSLARSDEMGQRLARALRDLPGVVSVGRRTGRGEGDEHAEGVQTSELVLQLDPQKAASRDAFLEALRARIDARLPGFPTAVEQPLAHLISHMLSGVAAQVAVKISGEDLGALRQIAAQVEGVVEQVPGVRDLMIDPQGLVDQVAIVPRRGDLARYGLRVADLAEAVELSLEGAELSRLYTGQFSYAITLRLREADRRNLDQIRALPLRSPGGRELRLRDVAEVGISRTPSSIKRDNSIRRLVVQHNVADRPISEVVAEIEAKLAPVRAELPAGYVIELSGQFEAQQRAASLILWLSLVSLLGMAALLFLHFRSLNLVLQTLANIPVALVGGGLAVLLTGQLVSVATLVGFISLGGIAARNKILLLDHYLHLIREEGMEFGPGLVLRAGQERIIPVLMTALTSGIGLLPLVLSPELPGRELLYPVATVIVGGLVMTTAVDLFLTPALVWVCGLGRQPSA